MDTDALSMDTDALSTPPKLILASPQGNGQIVSLVRPITMIGRSPGNHLVLESDLVSRRHAVLMCDRNVVTIRDLGSRNGTLVNGRPVQIRVLVSRDMIEIGDFLLRYLGSAVPLLQPVQESGVPSGGAMCSSVRRSASMPHRSAISPAATTNTAPMA